jgi:hydroxymethylbilane synthase
VLPAAGQGALAIEIRESDTWLRELLAPVHCEVTAACVAAERACMQRLGGGCRLPVAVLAEVRDDALLLRARVLSLDGTRTVEGAREEPWAPPRAGAPAGAGDTAETGRRLAEELLARGATEIIDEVAGHLREEQARG